VLARLRRGLVRAEPEFGVKFHDGRAVPTHEPPEPERSPWWRPPRAREKGTTVKSIEPEPKVPTEVTRVSGVTVAYIIKDSVAIGAKLAVIAASIPLIIVEIVAPIIREIVRT